MCRKCGAILPAQQEGRGRPRELCDNCSTVRRRKKRQTRDPICKADDCDKPTRANGYCAMHNRRVNLYGATEIPIKDHGNRRYQNRCSYEGCDLPHRSKGYCQMHYLRLKQRGDLGPVGKILRGRYKDDNGYVIVRKEGSRKILEHRLVMEQVLGRDLQPRENVHHKNGIRDDNSPENLELWVKPQPQGQRVSDLVAWVVASYPDEVEKQLKEFKNVTS